MILVITWPDFEIDLMALAVLRDVGMTDDYARTIKDGITRFMNRVAD
jgi:hypothetical protein